MHAQTLFGTTSKGGNDGGGTINKFIPATNNLTVARSFESFAANPYYTNFIQASNGKLYGVTAYGGSSGFGVIFSYDPLSATYTKLKDFDFTNGANPYGSLMQASDGKLYGMTYQGGSSGAGVIFSYDPLSSNYTKLKDFDYTNGAVPFGSLIQASDGKLYGLTNEGGSSGLGVIFSYDPLSSNYTKLKDFDNINGANPYGSLIQASNGKLYGMTVNGGISGLGVIFSYDPLSANYTKLKDFNGANGGNPYGSLMQASDGKLYGMTFFGGGFGSGFGVIFSFDPLFSTYTKLKDLDNTNGGGNAYGNLLQATNGKLYGMTSIGGSSSAGVIFSFDPFSSTYTKLKDFDITNGGNPYGSLMQAKNGKLYGVTFSGGNGGAGVIFSYDLSSSTYANLRNFDDNNGSSIYSSLIKAGNGKLYGITNEGGSMGAGVIFSFDPTTSTYAVVKNFDGTNGSNPAGSLIQGSDGKLYGMASRGGSSGLGVIFSLDPVSSTYTKLKDCNLTDGYAPTGSLIQASNGKLYGMTNQGGNAGAGVIFSYNLSTSTYTKLKDLVDINGLTPFGSLMQARDGKLYGMTSSDGNNDAGVIFSYDLSSSTLIRLQNFDDLNGTRPRGTLIQASNGKLYGMTAEGGISDEGVIFSFDPSSLTYKKLKDFDGANGAYPYGNLMQASDGKLYGMTNSGGSSDVGVIFSYDPSTSTYTKLQDYNGANGANPSIGSAFIEVNECIANTQFYRDADGDGYGDPANSTVVCSQPVGYVANNTDCNDRPSNGGAAVHPGAKEVCNGSDDDCDGSVDEGFADTDRDHLADCVDPDDDNDGIPDFKDCVPLDNKKDKVLICHKGKTLCVSRHAVLAHLRHGDTEGPCGGNKIKSKSRGNIAITNDLEVSKSNLFVPAEYKLSNYPNPFTGISTIKYELPFDSKVSIKVYDLMGRIVATLIDENKKAGSYTVDFKSGYLNTRFLYYRIIAKSKDWHFVQTNKMIQLK